MSLGYAAFKPVSQLLCQLLVRVSELAVTALKQADPTGKISVIRRQLQAVVRQRDNELVTNLELQLVKQMFGQNYACRCTNSSDFDYCCQNWMPI